jgi:hypothetical protein
MRICVCARVVRCSSGFRAACCDGLTSAWLAPSTQCVCLLWPRLWLPCRVWRSLPSTVAFMLGRPGGLLCSSKPFASVCDEIGCSAFACACTFTIASRLYGCGFCACDSSYGSTALTCARTCEALLLVGTCCGFCDACDSSCKSPRLLCCMTMHGVASSLLFIKKEERALPFVHARCVALAAALELCWACACCCCCSSSPDVVSGVGSIGWACVGTDQQIKQSFVSFKSFYLKSLK